MMDLGPFLFHFIATSLAAAALAAAGAHLATRQRTLQSLCLSQGAELGALASVIAAALAHTALTEAQTWWSLGGGLMGALVAGGLASQVGHSRTSSRTPRLFSTWIVLVAVTHLAVAIHPALESHLARVFLGDLATLSDAESIVVGLAGIVSLAFLIFARKWFARRTFDSSALGLSSARGQAYELVPFLILPAVPTWAAGFLFTCACLFVPTSLLAREGDSSARSTTLCAGVALVCAPLGLLLSLQFERIPTVPGIVALLTTFCLGLGSLRNPLRATR
jgi:ABC-type Mn2+/Zn2+ transport system permease subunit